MSDFKPTPESNMTTTQLLDRYQLHDANTLKTWASLHGIYKQDGLFSPSEVDLIDHVHHHIYNLGMTVDEYQNFLAHRLNRLEAKVETEPSVVKQNPVPDEITTEASQALELLMEQYSEAIELMGERIADHFIDELDLSVMRHLAKKVKERQLLNNQLARPNRFLKTIQAVLKPINSPLLNPPSPEETRNNGTNGK
jgi:DNA-binding transcriptional MerR regulator